MWMMKMMQSVILNEMLGNVEVLINEKTFPFKISSHCANLSLSTYVYVEGSWKSLRNPSPAQDEATSNDLPVLELMQSS